MSDSFQGEKKTKRKSFDLPQIAVKRRDSDCPSSTGAQVVLLNGSWDTSTRIPSIVAEMHNVNVDELRVFQRRQQVQQQQQIQQQLPQEVVKREVVSSPAISDCAQEIDCTDSNLSWLLNYKIQELPPVPDSSSVDPFAIQQDDPFKKQFSDNGDVKVSESDFQCFDEQNLLKGSIGRISGENKQTVEDPLSIGNNCKYTEPKKPPFTYTELIEYALSEKGELTVSGIYQWISDHFPFYKQNDDRWKNSVRHNLSINPHFRKGSKAIHGAGHLWTIAQHEDKKTWHIKKQRMKQFMQTNCNEWNQDKQLEMELATATASILPENSEENIKNGIVKSINGFKPQNIEVEYINIVDVSNGLEDFLCPPVSKEQVVEECGLGDDYLITDLNPQALGLNLAEAEIIAGGNIYDDDLNFQCYELQSE